MWNLPRNLTRGIVTVARSRETVKGKTTEEVTFSTAENIIMAITAKRKAVALAELKL
jgi:hypothetical protein